MNIGDFLSDLIKARSISVWGKKKDCVWLWRTRKKKIALIGSGARALARAVSLSLSFSLHLSLARSLARPLSTKSNFRKTNCKENPCAQDLASGRFVVVVAYVAGLVSLFVCFSTFLYVAGLFYFS
jgi:hypothetical protein